MTKSFVSNQTWYFRRCDDIIFTRFNSSCMQNIFCLLQCILPYIFQGCDDFRTYSAGNTHIPIGISAIFGNQWNNGSFRIHIGLTHILFTGKEHLWNVCGLSSRLDFIYIFSRSCCFQTECIHLFHNGRQIAFFRKHLCFRFKAYSVHFISKNTCDVWLYPT